MPMSTSEKLPAAVSSLELIQTQFLSEAEVTAFRYSGMMVGGQPMARFDDDQIRNYVREQVVATKWYSEDRYQTRTPGEMWQFDVSIAGQFNVYSYLEGALFSDVHERILSGVVSRYFAHFPGRLYNLKDIAIDNNLPGTMYGDSQRFPTHGYTVLNKRIIMLSARGLSLEPYRGGQLRVPTFQAVIAHELAHLTMLDEDLSTEWRQAGFIWDRDDYSLNPYAFIPRVPDQCVTDYAAIVTSEDICESAVAYLYQPDLLRRVSPAKFDILRSYDQSDVVVELPVRGRRVNPQIPKLHPVRYYIDEDMFKDML
ncbi:MAG: hypothetical protein ACYCPS_00430 [Candidatus Saccharimonadales bacterium]